MLPSRRGGGARVGPGSDAGSTPGLRRVLDLPADPVAARTARRFVGQLLVEGGRSSWTDAAEAACTELVTNALLHAHSGVTLTVEVRAAELYVGVHDTSADLPRQRAGDGRATTGRGMSIVARLTSSHGVSLDASGKTVWFVIDATVAGETAEPSVDDLLSTWTDDEEPGPGRTPGAATDRASDRGDQDIDAPPSAAADPDDRAGGPVVRLLGVPSSLWLAAEEHHRTILRELVLYLAEHPADEVDLEASDAASTALSDAVGASVEHGRASGLARRPLPEGHPAYLPDVPDRVDADLVVPTGTASRFAALQDTLDLAERLAVEGRLLARPGLPEVVAVRDWACEQVLAQGSGAPAGPWSGTDHERFLAREDLPDEASSWEVTSVRTAGRPVVAADDTNRIIALSPAMADLVGWDRDELVGRRVVTLIPPRLREGHVAGFSRHLSTGEAKLLGMTLHLPVLHADGTEVGCAVRIEQAAALGGRRLYLAWFDPVTGAGREATGATPEVQDRRPGPSHP